MKPLALIPALSFTVIAAPCLTPGDACTERLATGKHHVRIYRTHALSGPAESAPSLAYIMVHGMNRNADDYFAWTLASTAAAGRLDSTAVASIHFKARSADGGDPVAEGELYWNTESWKSGEIALNGPESSFDALDALVRAFAGKSRFPNIKEIIVAGHSAGGQFVQRYAAANRIDPVSGVQIRYVVANPSSYVYMSPMRLRAGAACTQADGCNGPFIPYFDAVNCTTYNRYRYGLDSLSGYAAKTGADEMRKQFAARRVIYLAGELDTNTADPSLDKSCPAQSQGPNRRERAVTFWNSMRLLHGARHLFAVAPGCGHSAVCVFAGPAGVKAVFGPFE